MKRTVSAVIAAFMCLWLISCEGGVEDGSKQSGGREITESVSEIGEALFTGCSYEDDLQPLGEDTSGRIEFVAAYYAVTEDNILDAMLYTGSGATPEEICVIKAASGTVNEIEAAMKARVEVLKTDFTDYRPEQMPKLDDAVIYVNGDYAVLCVSADSPAAESVLKGIFG